MGFRIIGKKKGEKGTFEKRKNCVWGLRKGREGSFIKEMLRVVLVFWIRWVQFWGQVSEYVLKDLEKKKKKIKIILSN